MRNHYQTLGLEPSASAAAIKKAYRLYAAKLHPDRNQNDDFFTERFREVQEAYQILSDPIEKQRYDREIQGQQKYLDELLALRAREAELRRREQRFRHQQQNQKLEEVERQKLKVLQFVFFALFGFICLYLILYYARPRYDTYLPSTPQQERPILLANGLKKAQAINIMTCAKKYVH